MTVAEAICHQKYYTAGGQYCRWASSSLFVCMIYQDWRLFWRKLQPLINHTAIWVQLSSLLCLSSDLYPYVGRDHLQNKSMAWLFIVLTSGNLRCGNWEKLSALLSIWCSKYTVKINSCDVSEEGAFPGTVRKSLLKNWKPGWWQPEGLPQSLTWVSSFTVNSVNTTHLEAVPGSHTTAEKWDKVVRRYL